MKKILLLLALCSISSFAFAKGNIANSQFNQNGGYNANAMQVTPTGLTSNTLANWLASLYNTGGPNVVETVSGTTYAIQASDASKTKVFTNADDVAVSLVQATTTGFGTGYAVRLENASAAGIVTVTPATSTIRGATTWKLAPRQSGLITSDGANYYVTEDTTLGNIWYPYTDTTFGGSTAVGIGALSTLASASATAFSMTAVGYHALGEGTITGANKSTAVGYGALKKVTSGNNVAVGNGAGDALTSGTTNVAIGTDALSAAVDKNSNTAVGNSALTAANSHENTAVGYRAGVLVTSGQKNTLIGMNAAATVLTTGSNNIIISNGADVTTVPAASTSSWLNIGNALRATLTAPTISSGFGTTPSVVAGTSSAGFTVNVGTGGTANSGVIAFPVAAPTGWTCHVTNTSNPATSVVVSTPTSTTTATFTNYARTTGLLAAWAASDVLLASCNGY